MMVVIRRIAVVVVEMLVMRIMYVPIAFSFALALARAPIQNAVRPAAAAFVIPLRISDTHIFFLVSNTRNRFTASARTVCSSRKKMFFRVYASVYCVCSN